MDRREKLLTSKEIAEYFLVEPKTVTRWAHDGRIPSELVVVTPGGHYRFRAHTIEAIKEITDELTYTRSGPVSVQGKHLSECALLNNAPSAGCTCMDWSPE